MAAALDGRTSSQASRAPPRTAHTSHARNICLPYPRPRCSGCTSTNSNSVLSSTRLAASHPAIAPLAVLATIKLRRLFASSCRAMNACTALIVQRGAWLSACSAANIPERSCSVAVTMRIPHSPAPSPDNSAPDVDGLLVPNIVRVRSANLTSTRRKALPHRAQRVLRRQRDQRHMAFPVKSGLKRRLRTHEGAFLDHP